MTSEEFEKSSFVQSLIKRLDDSTKLIKDTRADLNTMAKYFNDDNQTIKEQLIGLAKDMDSMDKDVLKLADEFQETIKDVVKNEFEADSENDYIKQLLSDDFKEREQKLLEEVEKIVISKLPKSRKKFLGIF